MLLQGTAIPRLIRLLPPDWDHYKRPHKSLLLEDVGQSLEQERPKLSEQDCDDIFELYERLHAQGFVHGDVAPRNIAVRRCTDAPMHRNKRKKKGREKEKEKEMKEGKEKKKETKPVPNPNQA